MIVAKKDKTDRYILGFSSMGNPKRTYVDVNDVYHFLSKQDNLELSIKKLLHHIKEYKEIIED